MKNPSPLVVSVLRILKDAQNVSNHIFYLKEKTMKNSVVIAIFLATSFPTLFAYTPVLEGKVICLKSGETLDAGRFEFRKIEPLRENQTCYVLIDYVKLPPEKAQAAKEAAKKIYERIGQDKK